MACEETSRVDLGAKTAVTTIVDYERCTTCGRSCCNCELCLKQKGRKNVCGPCRRAELAKKKEGA